MIKGSRTEITEKQTDRRQVGEAKHVSDNWHFSLLSFFRLHWSLPLLCVLALRAVHLPFLSVSDLSFTMPRAIQKQTGHSTPAQSASLLGQLFASTALSHISAYCSKKSHPQTHTQTHTLYIGYSFTALWRSTPQNATIYITFLHVHKQQHSYTQHTEYLGFMNETRQR